MILGAAAVCVVWMGLGERGIAPLYETEKERQEVLQRINKLLDENEALRRRIQKLKTDRDYVEFVARRELRLIGPHEVFFQFAPDDETPFQGTFPARRGPSQRPGP